MKRAPLSLRHLAIPLLLLAMSCRTEPLGEEPIDPEFEALGRQMEELVGKLIAESLKETRSESFLYEDGREGTRRTPHSRARVIPAEGWTPLGMDPVETPGRVIAEFELDRRPWALLVDDAGTCIIARQDDVLIVNEDGSTRTLEYPGITSLQWSSDGARLMLDSPDAKRLFLWPSLEPELDLLAEGFRGRLHFAPQSEAIWQVSDIIDPDPSSEVRVLIVSIRERAVGAAQDVDVLSGPLALAGFGTFPQIGQSWGHRIRSGMILPRPAPLWLLGENLRPDRAITDPGEKVDLRPTTSRDGTMVFLRTRRVIDSDEGLRLAPNTRAGMGDLESPDSQIMISGEPTYAVAVSPNGQRVALQVERQGKNQLILTEPDAIESVSLDSSIAAMRAFEEQASQVLDELREMWATTPWHPILEADEVAYERPLMGADEVLEKLSTALRSALVDEHGLTLPDSLRGIALLDEWLLNADGLVMEENATILAIGALYGDLLSLEEGVDWDTLSILPSLSNDLTVATERERDLFRVHSPFYVAREAISGRLSLREAAADVLEDQQRSVGLVENFSDRAKAGYALSELQRVGIDFEDEVSTDTWRRIVEREPTNLIANEAAWSAATARGEAGIAFAAAMNMAETDPTSPDFLLRFARELLLIGLDDSAIRLFDHTAVLAPDDPEVRLAVATAYFDLYRLDDAERLLLRIARDFPGEATVVADHLDVLRELRTMPTEED